MQRKLHERADTSQNFTKTNYLRSCISTCVDLFRNVPTAIINTFLPCCNVVKNPPILSLRCCTNRATAALCDPGQIHFSFRATRSRSNMLALAAISPSPPMLHTFSCFACITSCFGARPTEESHVELQRDPQTRTEGSVLHRPRMEIRALLCKMGQNRT